MSGRESARKWRSASRKLLEAPRKPGCACSPPTILLAPSNPKARFASAGTAREKLPLEPFATDRCLAPRRKAAKDRHDCGDVVQHEGGKCSDRWARRKPGRGRQIGAHGQPHYEHDEKQKGAAIPREEILKIGECSSAPLGREPVFLVRQVDP